MKRLLAVLIDHRLLKNFSRCFYRGLPQSKHVPAGHWPIANSMDGRTNGSSATPTRNKQRTARNLHQNGQYSAHRRWETVASGGGSNSRNGSSSTSGPRDRFEFTLMNYNILAQDLLDSHAALYGEHDPEGLPWDLRCKRLLAEINTIKPDILCVQELQETHAESFCSGLPQHYAMLYKKRTGNDKTDGCALFYRRDLFELVTHHKVEFYQPKVNKLNRENVAIIAKLALKANPRAKLVISTTHLLYNPRRQDVRLAQVQVLLAELDRLAFSGTMPNGIPRYEPVILCGDFNLQPFTAPYELLTKGFLRYDRLDSRSLQPANSWHGHVEQVGKYFLPPALGITDKCQHTTLRDREKVHRDKVPPSHLTKLYHSNHEKEDGEPSGNDSPSKERSSSSRSEFSSGALTHQFVFSSAYRHYGPDSAQDRRQATTFQDEWITVDYLFYTPYRSVAECTRQLPNWNLELLQTYSLPTVQQCGREIGYIPNRQYGSDHFSLAGRFLLTVPRDDQ
ncbi:protein angel [Anopheles arabiensis]|uniref:protein angel n=1 Tax=Anopheles arabiensis TaxID=7173 RepID=UPI001AAE0448|nr:protein angel [Anopheles arabiensis]